MMASHCPEAQGKSIKRAVLTGSLLQCGRGPEDSGSLPDGLGQQRGNFLD
jgi:hypothetical protein